MAGRLISVLSRLDRAGRAVETTLLVLLLAALLLVAVGQIVLRELFTFGFIWANELQNLLVLWLAMIAAAAAARDNRHIRIDALSHVLPDGLARAARTLVDLFAAAVSFVLAWQVFLYLQIEHEYGDKVMLDVPAWLAHAVLAVAFALSGLRFAGHALRAALGLESIERGERQP